MDLETITDNLTTGVYSSETEFYTDIDLILEVSFHKLFSDQLQCICHQYMVKMYLFLQNSLAYNTRKTSEIYKMTIRFKEYYMELIQPEGTEVIDHPHKS